MRSRTFLQFTAAMALLYGSAEVVALPPFLLQQTDSAGPPPTADGGPIPGRGRIANGGTRDPETDRMIRQMENSRNVERQKSLVQDTQQLLKLANELNDVVGKSNEGMLSLDVIKKAEEVEKLAKQVKDKMRGN